MQYGQCYYKYTTQGTGNEYQNDSISFQSNLGELLFALTTSMTCWLLSDLSCTNQTSFLSYLLTKNIIKKPDIMRPCLLFIQDSIIVSRSKAKRPLGWSSFSMPKALLWPLKGNECQSSYFLQMPSFVWREASVGILR